MGLTKFTLFAVWILTKFKPHKPVTFRCTVICLVSSRPGGSEAKCRPTYPQVGGSNPGRGARNLTEACVTEAV